MYTVRLQQWIGTACLAATVLLAGAAFTAGSRAPTRADPTIGSIASQLGVSVALGADDDFALGVQFTGTLQAPEKLDLLGIQGMHAGARVYAARIGQERVQVEADELSPPRRATAKLRLDQNGKLLAAPKPVATIER